MSVYLWIRFLDLAQRGELHLLLRNRTETWLFALEIALALVPTALLYQSRIRRNPAALYACSVMMVFSFIANRLNVAITGMEVGSGTHYIPKWSEVSVTLMLVAFGFAIFRVIGQYFPVFEAHSLESAAQDGVEREVDPLAVG